MDYLLSLLRSTPQKSPILAYRAFFIRTFTHLSCLLHMSIQTATEQLKTIMDSIAYYQTTSVGLTYDFARLKENDFPIIHASISETSIDVGTTVITYEVISIDLPNEAQTDLMSKLYATHSNLNTVISNYINTNDGYVPQLPVSIEPLDYFVEHSACGWRAFLSIEISNENSVC